MINFSMQGRRVAITGAGGGIGREIALSCAHNGADIVAFSLLQDEIDSLAVEVRALGRKFSGLAGSVENRADIERLARLANEELGGVDILINNAGMSILEPALSVTPATWAKQFSVNVDGAFACSQAFAPGMLERGWGRIINLSSQASYVGLENHTVYAAAKGALNALTFSLAFEWGPRGVTVNAVAPTVILTELGERVWGDPRKGGPLKARLPIRRFGTPDEVAAACLYLASDVAGLCNGHVLVLDGGYTIS